MSTYELGGGHTTIPLIDLHVCSQSKGAMKKSGQ